MGKVKADRKITVEEDFGPGKDGDFWETGADPFFDEEEQHKVKLLKEKLVRPGESADKKKQMISQNKELERAIADRDELEKRNHELQILMKTMEANLHQLEGERRQYLGKLEENSKAVAVLQDKNTQFEEDLKNLTAQLRARTQENILLNKENKELQRANNQLRESVTLLEEKVRSLEREIAQNEPSRREMERKFNGALESLRAEVKAKHQNILTLTREVAELQKTNQKLNHARENLELELDMLNSTNVSLQKKVDKLTAQRDQLEWKLQNRLVRLALAISSLFGCKPERTKKNRHTAAQL